MATIAKLDIALRGHTSAFDRKMKRSTRSVGGLGRSLKGLGRNMLKFGGIVAGIAGIGGAAGIFMLVRRQMELIDATAKLSARLNVATEDLIGLGHAAEITGVATEVMMKSVEMFVRRIGEVRQGTGEAVRALEKLNLTADQLADVSPAEGIGLVADRMKLLANAADKGVVAYQIFGRAGIKLLNLLELGSKGIAEMTAEAEKLGITFSAVDAAGVEAANDAITRVKAVLTGVVRVLAIKLAPIIELGANMFIEWANSGEGAGKKVSSGFEVAAKAVARFAEGLSVVVRIFDHILAGIRLVVDGALDLARLLANVGVFTFTGETDSPLAGFAKFVDDYHNDTLKVMEALQRSSLATRGGAGKKIDDFFRGVQERMAKLRAEMEKTAAARKQHAAIVIAAEAYGKAAKQIDKFNDKLRMQVELFGLSQSQLQFRKMQDLVKDVPTSFLQAFNDKLAETARLLEEMDRKKAFAAQADQIKKFADGVKDSLKTPIDKFREFRDAISQAVKAGELSRTEGLSALEKRMAGLMGKTRRGEFTVIDPANMSISGMNLTGANPEVDEQKKTNELLSQILRTFDRAPVDDGVPV